MQDDQHSENRSVTESVSFSDSDDDMFGNLAPVNTKLSVQTSSNQHSKILMAKMKRLIGPSFNTKTAPSVSFNSTLIQQTKLKANKKANNKKTLISEESKLQSDNQSLSQDLRERSRDKNSTLKTAESLKSSSGLKRGKTQDAANLSIQKQVVKQNDNLSSNKISNQKHQLNSDQKQIDAKKSQRLERFADMEKMLFVPVQDLPILRKSSEEVREEKREKKRLDRMLDKKYKEYKVGKVKDQASNCVFNGIEDYFN